MDANDEYQQEEPSSCHLLCALEDLLKRSDHGTVISRIKYQSKSVDDLFARRRHRHRPGEDEQQCTDADKTLSNRTLIELDLSGWTDDDDEHRADDFYAQRSRSAPILSQELYDKELATFVQGDHQQHQQSLTDSFVYNIDLSDSDQTSRQLNSKLAIFFEDDFSSDDLDYEPVVSHLHSSLITNCLTITEENEDELEQLDREDDEEQQSKQNLWLTPNTYPTPRIVLLDDADDETILFENDQPLDEQIDLQLVNMNKHEGSIERLSTIYESPSPQPDIDEDVIGHDDDKLVVYDFASTGVSAKLAIVHPIPESTSSTSMSHRSPVNPDQGRPTSCYTEASLDSCTKPTDTLPASQLCGTTTTILSKMYNPSSFSSVTDNAIILAPSPPSQQPSSPTFFHTEQAAAASRRSSQHIQTMRVIQSSSSSLSDFISTPAVSQNTIGYEHAPNVHHSLSECSLIHQTSSPVENDDLNANNILDVNERRTPLSRRILTNGLLFPRRSQDPLISFDDYHYSVNFPNEEKFLSDTSSSSELLSSSDEKLLSRSEYLLRQEQRTSQQRKASSLKSILAASPPPSSKILYPIDFGTSHANASWQQKRSSDPHGMPIFDSGIVTDARPTSRSSINEDASHGPINLHQLQQHEINYHTTLTDLSLIKKNIVDIESRLNEVVCELDIEQALIESEHELVFKQILDASESDQDKIRQLHINLQLRVERMMTEKTSIRHQIHYTQQILFKLEHDIHGLEQHYRSSDETILHKRETLAAMRKKYEDLEFQLMELEARCDSELEQVEEQFHNEQRLVTQNAKMRQNTLRELDHQQYMALHQATLEKDKLEREKQKLKLLYKQKKSEASEYEGRVQDIRSHDQALTRAVYPSTPHNLYSSLNYRDRVSSPKMSNNAAKRGKASEMMAKMKLDEITNLEQQLRECYNDNTKRLEKAQKLADGNQNQNYHVKLRDKTRTQERPLTRYLPIRSADFDLRAHIEGAGHLLNSPHLSLTPTTCRGYLHKMGGMKFKTWNRRWFVFDRQRRALAYYLDRNETKLRGSIDFQSILEVYIDQLQSISLRSPEPREATFIVKTIQRPYYLVAPTVELMRIWIDVIITGAEGNTFASV